MRWSDGGRINANVAAAKAQYDAAAAQYRQKTRDAVREVEQALVRWTPPGVANPICAKPPPDIGRLSDATRSRHQAGLAGPLELEEASRLALTAETNLACLAARTVRRLGGSLSCRRRRLAGRCRRTTPTPRPSHKQENAHDTSRTLFPPHHPASRRAGHRREHLPTPCQRRQRQSRRHHAKRPWRWKPSNRKHARCRIGWKPTATWCLAGSKPRRRVGRVAASRSCAPMWATPSSAARCWRWFASDTPLAEVAPGARRLGRGRSRRHGSRCQCHPRPLGSDRRLSAQQVGQYLSADATAQARVQSAQANLTLAELHLNTPRCWPATTA